MIVPAPDVYAGPVTDITIQQPDSFVISDFGVMIAGITAIGLIVAGVLMLLYLVWGGIQWITSGGDKAQIEGARGRITNALIGLTIVASAWALIGILEYMLGTSFTTGLQLPRLYQ